MSQPAALSQGIGLWGVVSLGLGTAVGVSIFSAVSPATAVAGPAMLLSVLVAALPMYLIAVSYAYLGSAIPVTGASFVWPSRFLSPLLGFIIVWMRIIGSMGAIVILALVLVRYVAMLVDVPTKPAMVVVLLMALLANLAGVRFAARFQTTMIAGLVVLFLGFCLWGALSVDPANFEPFAPRGEISILIAAPLLMGLFFGIEAATETGAEVVNGKRSIPLGIAIAIGSATILYVAVGVVAVGILGGDALAVSEAPILETAEVFMGPVAIPLIVAAAVVAIGTSLNAIFAVFSRSLLAMGEAGLLPPVFARVQSRTQVPHVALIAVFALGCFGLLLPMELTFLFLAVNIPNLVKYGSICLVAARVARRHPEIHEEAGFQPSRANVVRLGFAGTTCAFLLIVVGFQADWRPYALLLGWAVAGLLWYAFMRRAGRQEM